MKLGILDQSAVRNGASAAEAVAETIETAILAEHLGYSRFWVSEHHNSSFIAGSAPEVLMVRLADSTRHIRVGSGGIMLPNHSAFKVAENFRMLEVLFPGRIDLGMGRAPGGDRVSSMLLNPSNDFLEESYITQLEHLQHFFKDTSGTKHGPIRAVPMAKTIPEQWILSSSGGSSLIAARFGLGLVLARFINGAAGSQITDTYRKNFQATGGLAFSEPKVIVASFVLCADTEPEALAMRNHLDFVLLQFSKGNYENFPDAATVAKYRFSASDFEQLKAHHGRVISGTQDDVADKLRSLSEEFQADELLITTMGTTKENRKRSFELVAESFSLSSQLLV